VCPLYLFPDNGSFANISPNINPAIANKIAEGIGLKYIECLLGDTAPTGTISPVQIFDYVYAVLHNLTYREVYKVSADDCKAGKLYINETQYFQGIPQEVLEFTIGAYQPALKWLRDRHELTLDYDMVVHYQKMIFAISETLRIMGEMAD